MVLATGLKRSFLKGMTVVGQLANYNRLLSLWVSNTTFDVGFSNGLNFI